MQARLVDSLAEARRQAFVGRSAELELFRRLDAARGGVLFVHGHAGVGKTTLLDHYAWLGENAGRRVVRLDGRDLSSPAAAATLPEVGGRALLLIDAVELLGPIDCWLRGEVLPALPEDTVVVLAGREPTMRRMEPGWHSVRLTNLDDTEARTLLRKRGVPPEEHRAAIRLTRGHPLGLALLADVHAQRGDPYRADVMPEVVATLLKRLLDAVPGPAHRAALEACSLVRVITAGLLAELLGVPDARALFRWLRSLSIVEHGERGYALHETAGAVLAAELRWRHPDRYALLRRRAGTSYQRRFAAADAALQREILVDFVYLHRDSPVLGPFLRPLGTQVTGLPGALSVGRPQPSEWPVLRAMVERHEGARSARLADHWYERQPDAIHVIRNGDGRLVAFYALVALHTATAADRAADPGAAACWEHLRRHAPLADAEAATMVRFWMDGDAYQAMSPAQILITLQVVRHYLTTAGLAYTFLPCAEPDAWARAFAYADLARPGTCDFVVGGRTYGVFGHDWRLVPPMSWLALLAERELADDPLDVTAPPA